MYLEATYLETKFVPWLEALLALCDKFFSHKSWRHRLQSTFQKYFPTIVLQSYTKIDQIDVAKHWQTKPIWLINQPLVSQLKQFTNI